MNCYRQNRLTVSPKMLEYIRETTNKSLEKYNNNMGSLLVIKPITSPNGNGSGSGVGGGSGGGSSICMWIFFMGVVVGYQCSIFFTPLDI